MIFEVIVDAVVIEDVLLPCLANCSNVIISNVLYAVNTYLIFNVKIANAASKILTIQKRNVIFDS